MGAIGRTRNVLNLEEEGELYLNLELRPINGQNIISIPGTHENVRQTFRIHTRDFFDHEIAAADNFEISLSKYFRQFRLSVPDEFEDPSVKKNGWTVNGHQVNLEHGDIIEYGIIRFKVII